MTSRTNTPEDVQKIMKPWRDSASEYERGFIDGMQKQMQSSVDKAVNRLAQRTWVGLTDEEIQECFKITPDQHLPWHIYQRIEAKLKEKNT